ncbi:helix-turn-helix domain-containing protein [Pseudonocardia eucalypti]|uniref:Helix-turn-helix domain-containing protein n=1 Tax=Pseudonocardia eucalypti TaxID=648755 RepID=A0ABP9QWP6_9PSEU|nr:DNA-binding HxlR family transcriptional regulator [Pseudonocardia eucalypti]
MLDSDYPGQVCSIARALEVVGERWTLLILRDALLGPCRFDDLVESLGVTRTVLSNRLAKLVEHGLLERRRYQVRPERFEYLPTPKALELLPVLGGLMAWGDRHYPHPAGPPRRIVHRHCGGGVTPRYSCDRCGSTPAPAEVHTELNPALAPGAPRH